MKKARVVFEVYVDVEYDEAVVAPERLKELAQSHYKSLATEEGAVKHIAWNAAMNHMYLSEIDGWADMSDDLLRCRVDTDDGEVFLEEG